MHQPHVNHEVDVFTLEAHKGTRKPHRSAADRQPLRMRAQHANLLSQLALEFGEERHEDPAKTLPVWGMSAPVVAEQTTDKSPTLLLVIPFIPHHLAGVRSMLRSWGQEHRLPCSNSTENQSSNYIDLLMYGSNEVKDNMRDELAKLSYELKAFKHCFRSVQWMANGGTTHAVATPHLTLGIGRCTVSQMFFKVMDMGRKYSAVFWMEMDTLPLKTNWLNLLYSHVKHGVARKMGLLYVSSETDLTGISSPLDPLREHPMMRSGMYFMSNNAMHAAAMVASRSVPTFCTGDSRAEAQLQWPPPEQLLQIAVLLSFDDDTRVVKPVCWFRGWLGCTRDSVGAHNRTASRSDTLFHHKLVVPTNLSTAVEQHTNWLPELANEARMAPAAGANQTIIHPSVARFPVPPPSKMGPVAACAACAPYRLESLSSWSFRSPYELHKHFSAELLQRQELADVLSPRRAHLLNSLDSQLLHSLCNWKTGPTAVPGKTAPRPSEAKNNGQPTLGLNVTGLGWRSGLRQREPALGLVRTLLEGRKTFLVRKRQRGTAVLVVRQHPDAVEGQQVQGPGTVVALAVLEDAVQGLANISTAPSIQAAVRGLIGDWFKLGGNVGVDPNLFKTRTLLVHSMCVSAAQPLGRFMAVGALNALAVDFGIQAIAGVFPYWDMLYRNYHGLGFRPLETMVWAEEWDDDKEAPELHWRLATVPASAHDDDTYYLSFKLPTQYTPREQIAPGLPEGTELMALLHMLEKKGDAGKAVLLRMITNLVAGIKQTQAYQRNIIVLPRRVVSAAGQTSWSDVTEQTLAADLAQLIKNCSAVLPAHDIERLREHLLDVTIQDHMLFPTDNAPAGPAGHGPRLLHLHGHHHQRGHEHNRAGRGMHATT